MVFSHDAPKVIGLKMHISKHQKNISPLQCLFRQFTKYDIHENAAPQTSRNYSFSPVCLDICLNKCGFRENTDPQTSHK